MEEKKMSQKRMILLGITALIILFTILSLCFNVIKIVDDGEISSQINGFKMISQDMAEWKFFGTWLNIYSVVLLIVGIVGALVYVYIILKKQNAIKNCEKRLIIIILIAVGIYMINGFIAVAKTNAMYKEMYEGTFMEKYMDEIRVVTGAFIPFIIVAVLAITYYIVDNKMVQENIVVSKAKENIDNIEAIEKYKKLLDEGIITQEQFEKKKNELLNL